MAKRSLFLGLDVHAETIAVAAAEGVRGGQVRSLGVIPNSPQALRRLLKKLGAPGKIHACYEAGPCGYALYWQLTEFGVDCEVVAPTLVPVKAGDRVKTDRRDALKLARSHRAGELTAVWVPEPAHEALRDLVRAREVAKRDQLRARQRLGKFLLRRGLRRPERTSAWGARHLEWMRSLTFEHRPQQAVLVDYLAEVDHAADRIRRLEQCIDEAIEELPRETRALVAGLQALRGVAQMTAVSVVAEVGRFSRFMKPAQLMGYSGVVPSEHSSGARVLRHGITHTGNAHLRRVLVEAAWSCRHRPAMGLALKKRQEGLSEPVKEIAWKAQHRLHRRYWKLLAAGKPKQKVVTAVARELLGFIWAIGVAIEQEQAAMGPGTRAAA
jgi:transposase